MAEHRIRLRGAWELIGAGAEGPRRVDLPTTWTDAEVGQACRLVRRLGRPKFDAGAETVDLELADVAGLGAIRLNGLVLLIPGDDRGRIGVGDALLDRNVLELEVDLDRAREAVPWGTIALVIAGRKG